MKQIMILIAIGLMFGSCKKDDGGTQPPPQDDGFSFPANATKFAATLYAPTTSVASGATFDVRFVLYNISDAFGAAAEITYSSDKVQIIESIVGPAFTPASDIISLRGPISGTNRYAFGVSYRQGTGRVTSGSGVIVKLSCRATAPGAATFAIDPAKFEIKKSDGTPINNFNAIILEPVTVTIN